MWDSAICYVFHIIAHMEALAVDFGERVRVGAFFFYVFMYFYFFIIDSVEQSWGRTKLSGKKMFLLF